MDTTSPWVAIQRNPTSGAGRHRPLAEFIAGLREHGLRPRLFSTRQQLDLCVSDPELRSSLHGIVAAGGDGTVLDVINRYPGVPIGILPLGTENLLARHLKIPWSGRGAAEVVACGRVKPLDLGRVDSCRFTTMVSVGFDAQVIHAAHARRMGHIRRTHYIRPIVETLRMYGYPELRVFCDDAAEPVIGRMVVVANTPGYALRLRVVPTARGDDGYLDVRVFHRGSTFQMLRYLYMVARGCHDTLPDVTCLRARRVRIESSTPVAVQADGDPAGTTPCAATVDSGGALLFVPG
jgi:diacylglycerol kinase (ATP)